MKTDKVASLIATIGGLGDRLPAPGTTAGSLPAALLWWVATVLLDDRRQLLAVTAIGTVVFTATAVWACDVEARRRADPDPRPVAIDEVAGQWFCLLVALLFVRPEGAAAAALYAASGFFLFRLFDIVKPWPVRRLERLHGGFGIVADDLAAGALAGIVLGVGWRLVL
jgi:phosphatidylglycerophosphatase A